MSFSSLLLSSAPGIDTELDSLFKTTVPSAPAPAVSAPGPSKTQDVSGKKRKQAEEKEAPSKTSKRAKTSDKAAPEAAQPSKSIPKSALKEVKKIKEKKGKGKEKESQPIAEADEDDDSDIENAYANEKSKAKKTKENPEQLEAELEGEGEGDADADNEEEEEEIDLSALVHESLDPNSKSGRKTKAKVVPQDETPERRNQRTIFIGNLPLDVASKRPLSKQLRRHVLSFVPSVKVESIRFRSIPFQAPTAKLPASDDEDSGKPSKSTAPSKGPRAHDRERTSAWRSKADQEDDESVQKDEKRFLTPGQKKRVAFINQEFHTTADTVNAYLVFAHPPNTENRPSNLPPLPTVQDPYEAALLAVEKVDGTVFMERMIRVDLVSKDRSLGPGGETEGDKKAAIVTEDPKLSVFVGNLDFASKEEDLRVFFEGILAGERGPPDVALKGDTEGNSQKPLTWVTRVRIVRDKDTQLGKGFAYVQFSDRACVDELLAMDQDKLKFAKRKLRVQRCKTLPGVSINTGPTKDKSRTSVARPAVVVPKGNPALGATLVGLSKEERKKVKSTDADRVARRLAKKKARNTMKPSTKPLKPGKERKRVRS